MDKLILVFYINVSLTDMEGKNNFMEHTSMINNILVDEGIIYFILPIENGETRIECLNPKLLTEQEYSETKNTLEKIQEKLHALI